MSKLNEHNRYEVGNKFDQPPTSAASDIAHTDTSEQKQVSINEQELWSIDQVLKRLDISRTTLYHWRREGLLRYTRIRRRVFVFKADVFELMRRLSHGPPS